MIRLRLGGVFRCCGLCGCLVVVLFLIWLRCLVVVDVCDMHVDSVLFELISGDR